MKPDEARSWINGEFSMTNSIASDPNRESWLVRIEQADAAKIQQAYWALMAHHDGLMEEQN